MADISSEGKKSILEYLDGYPITYEKSATLTAEAPNVLIAGCGTGRHALEFGRAVPTAVVDAIDISSQSLAFAKLRQDESQIKNVRFSLKDIHSLNSRSERYNLIECAGVLHHTESPAKALSHLVAVLEPGGLILVGLYSTYARKEISSIRNKFNDEDRSEISAAGLRRERQKLLEREDFNRSWMNFSPDSFSISGFKDLFFNVQEHTYTLGQISSLLKKMALDFVGFRRRFIN